MEEKMDGHDATAGFALDALAMVEAMADEDHGTARSLWSTLDPEEAPYVALTLAAWVVKMNACPPLPIEVWAEGVRRSAIRRRNG